MLLLNTNCGIYIAKTATMGFVKLKKNKVLIFDKDIELANNIRIYLEDSFKVKIVKSIDDLITEIKINKFDFLLSEIDAKNQDFQNILNQIKTIQPGIKILLMYTYFDSDGITEKSILNAVDGYIFKPFDVNILKSKLSQLGLLKKLIIFTR